jgi:hypothetical protein
MYTVYHCTHSQATTHSLLSFSPEAMFLVYIKTPFSFPFSSHQATETTIITTTTITTTITTKLYCTVLSSNLGNMARKASKKHVVRDESPETNNLSKQSSPVASPSHAPVPSSQISPVASPDYYPASPQISCPPSPNYALASSQIPRAPSPDSDTLPSTQMPILPLHLLVNVNAPLFNPIPHAIEWVRLDDFHTHAFYRADNSDDHTPIELQLRGTVISSYLREVGQYGHSVTVTSSDNDLQHLQSILSTSPDFSGNTTFYLPFVNQHSMAQAALTFRCVDCLPAANACTSLDTDAFYNVWDPQGLPDDIVKLPLPISRHRIPANQIRNSSTVILEFEPLTYYIIAHNSRGCKLSLLSIGLIQPAVLIQSLLKKRRVAEDDSFLGQDIDY